MNEQNEELDPRVKPEDDIVELSDSKGKKPLNKKWPQTTHSWVRGKWFWIVILLIIILLLPIFKTVQKNRHNRPIKQRVENTVQPSSHTSPGNNSNTTTATTATTPKALENGTVFSDEINDWISTNQPGDNPTFYSVEYADLKSVTVAADDYNLYIKILVNDEFPKLSNDFLALDGDQIKATSFSFVIDKTTTSVSPDVEVDYGLTLEGNEVKPFATYSTGATGIRQPEEKRFTNKYTDPATIGGAGENFVIITIPLEKAGLKKGENITFGSSIETKSNKYHHASFDTLGQNSQKFLFTI